MKRSLLNKWIEALESGRYKKGLGQLRDSNDRFCCLGVLCDVMELPWGETDKGYHVITDTDRQRLNLPEEVWKRQGFSSHAACPRYANTDHGRSLAGINDTTGSFDPIIAILKERPHDYLAIEEDV